MNDLARIGAPPEAPARFTIDEFMELVNSSTLGPGKFELAEGVIVRMSPAQTQHIQYKWLVSHALEAALGNASGRVVHTELTLQLGSATLRDADIAVTLPLVAAAAGFPDPANVLLVVEIAASTLHYDLGVKLADYARAGIPHYWVVDVEGRRVHAMTTPLDGNYAERKLHAFGDPLPVPGTDRSIAID